MFEAVLFDLDGTLADTAPDLGGTVNVLLREEGRPQQPLETLRPWVSQGVRGLLQAGFGIDSADPDYERLTQRFLDVYAKRLCAETRLFDGVPELLDALESMGLGWGIVTNKRMRFTDPLVELLDLAQRTPCVVSGDTTAAAKPSPLPVLHACALLRCAPERTLYVGDDRRDIEAGRAAGCLTVAVSYGYLGDSGPLDTWGADLIIDHPAELTAFLASRVGPK
ncbi:HAD family hydrolase [Dechloromonas denitrificans]|uniref:HAD family hydrolase n=1 Tax=Dechloromonas denitrificans TaxID=281362 RepID=UPI001CFADAC1|nr:HAD-IA family hydrolase [Dechloromonas denitrificans]UCV06703.1 HAD-IA family hydrolase [Dechloromonas denitrificans]